MRFVILSVGKVKDGYLKSGVNDFMTRLRPYMNIDYVEGMEEKTPPNPSDAQIAAVVDKEGKRILAHLKEGDFLAALDSRGKQFTSEEMASKIQDWMNQGTSRVVFAIGGSHGLSSEVLKRADMTLSLSKMTFLHQMTVMILLEQLYRGMKIIKGEPYHK
ncbi:MAG: 23S rRNA (pseudouridine(1915)-N(3))-methyltransferase RlmH [Candidatus Saccharibacteria bacterium]